MPSINIIEKYAVAVITAILALVLTRLGISYLFILIAIGFIVSIITKSKSYAILTGILYAALGYAISYPSGLFLIQYMPTTNVTVEATSAEVGFNLITGALIPIIVAVIFCGIPAIMGCSLREYLQKDKKGNKTRTYDARTTPNNGYTFNNNNKQAFNNNQNNDTSSHGTGNSNQKEHHNNVIDKLNNTIKEHKQKKLKEKKIIYETPIQKAKDRKQKEKNQ